jgi:hypothetical protein
MVRISCIFLVLAGVDEWAAMAIDFRHHDTTYEGVAQLEETAFGRFTTVYVLETMIKKRPDFNEQVINASLGCVHKSVDRIR